MINQLETEKHNVSLMRLFVKEVTLTAVRNMKNEIRTRKRDSSAPFTCFRLALERKAEGTILPTNGPRTPQHSSQVRYCRMEAFTRGSWANVNLGGANAGVEL